MPDPDRHLRLLVRLGLLRGGGRVDPNSVLVRDPDSPTRSMFLAAQNKGWLDGQGWVTAAGRRALMKRAEDA